MEHVSSVRSTGKFPEKVKNLKRWSRFPGWNFRTESRVPFTFLVVCTSSRSTVGHRHVPGFMTKWNNFLPIGNSTLATTEISGFFFLNGKRPRFSPLWLATCQTSDIPTCQKYVKKMSKVWSGVHGSARSRVTNKDHNTLRHGYWPITSW